MMKTKAARAAERWVVDVEDERDSEGSAPGYWHRFYFDDPLDAWTCWSNAIRAGFKAKSEKVKVSRDAD